MNLKDILQSKKILYIIGGFLILAIVIILIIILLNLFKRYDYPEIETILVESTEKYLAKNKDLIPTTEEKEITVDANTLITNDYMKPWEKLTKDTNCTGIVTVNKNNEALRYTPTLECSNYKTTTLYEAILEKEEIQTSSEGLYDINDYYTYKGEYVNNLISFAGFNWQIFKFDESVTYLILADTTNKKELYVFDDRFNETINSNRGKNNFATSRIYLSLKDIYEKTFANKKQYLIPVSACIEPRNEKETDKTGMIECTTTFSTPISIMSVYDYMNASNDSLCNSTLSRNCSNYNYLTKAKNKWWLINGNDKDTYSVYGVDTQGRINSDYAVSKKDLRPVITIPSNSVFRSGNGTSSSPYKLFEY